MGEGSLAPPPTERLFAELLKSQAPHRIKFAIGDLHMQAYRCHKFGFYVNSRCIKEVKDWLYMVLKKEEEKEKKGEEFDPALKLGNVWPRVMLEKSLPVKQKWARLYNFKEEVDDLLENNRSLRLEAYVEDQRFKVKVAPVLEGTPSAAEIEVHRKAAGASIVQVKSESDWQLFEENISEMLGVTAKALEKGALERARA